MLFIDTFKRIFVSRTYRIAQSGLLQWFYKIRFPRLFGDSELNLDELVSYQLFLPEAPEPEIRLNNIRNFCYIYFTCIAIAFMVLIYEVMHNQSMKRKECSESLNGEMSLRRNKSNKKNLTLKRINKNGT